MKSSLLLRKAKERLRRDLRLKADPRYIRTIGLLSGKGLLVSPGIPSTPNTKLSISDAYWVAEKIEPRVWEVLPAAVLHFPRSFLGVNFHPDLLKCLSELRLGDEGSDFHNVPFSQVKRWAERKPKDGRTKSLSDLKVMRSFRLSKKSLETLKRLADRARTTQSKVIESLIGSQESNG